MGQGMRCGSGMRKCGSGDEGVGQGMRRCGSGEEVWVRGGYFMTHLDLREHLLLR